jgi:hypothetical protein
VAVQANFLFGEMEGKGEGRDQLPGVGWRVVQPKKELYKSWESRRFCARELASRRRSPRPGSPREKRELAEEETRLPKKDHAHPTRPI